MISLCDGDFRVGECVHKGVRGLWKVYFRARQRCGGSGEIAVFVFVKYDDR